MQNSVKSEKINGEKCYKISVKEGQAEKTVWITKSRSFPIKAEIKYQYEFNTVTDEDVELPDFTEYTIYDYKTKEQVKAPENNNLVQ